MNEQMKAAFARGVELAKIARLEGESARESEGVHTHIHSRADELIACLEGEIAKRDARIVELHANLSGCRERAGVDADELRSLRAELSAIKAQEPVAWPEGGSDAVEGAALGAFDSLGQPEHDLESWCAGYAEAVYAHAAQASEAKAQGVVMPDNLLSHRVTWRQAFVRLIELEDVADPETGRDDKAYWQHELRAFDDMYADLDRLNAAPVQQVSVPDGWKLVPDHADADAIVTALYRRFKDWAKQGFGPEDVTWCEVKADILAMLSAAPAAPAADAGVNDHD